MNKVAINSRRGLVRYLKQRKEEIVLQSSNSDLDSYCCGKLVGAINEIDNLLVIMKGK